MPQNNMNNGGRRKGSHPYSFEANTPVSNGVGGTDLVSGAVLHNDCPTAASKTSGRKSNGTENRNTPPCIVNGHINSKCNGFVRKTAPPWTNKKRGSRISAVTDASASDRVINAGTSHGVPVNGEVVALPHDSEKSHKADAKNHRPWKKFKRKKRAPEVNCAEIPTSPLTAPPKEEDWEKEIEEVTLTGWEKICYGINPDGPEDLLHFDMRDLTLKQRDMAPLPVTANYCPAKHHPHPLKWTCHNVPVESDQFADADE